MKNNFSLSTYLAAFGVGSVLAALGILLYTGMNGPEAPAQAAAPPSPTMSAPPARRSAGPAEQGRPALAEADLPTVTVYKSPTCGCCSKWVDHMKEAGFTVETQDMNDVGAKKDALGVPQRLRSCHTAQVGDYVVEGHVPADDVKRMLAEAPGSDAARAASGTPAIDGIATPGMPVGSPGMEVPGRPAQPYRVIAFDRGRATSVFAQH